MTPEGQESLRRLPGGPQEVYGFSCYIRIFYELNHCMLIFVMISLMCFLGFGEY